MNFGQGADKDNGLVPVLLKKHWNNYNMGEVAGMDRAEAERVAGLDCGTILVKMRATKPFVYKGEQYEPGQFVAAFPEDVKSIEKKNAASVCVPIGDAMEPPARPE